jgi:hypothetical protein
MMMMMMMMMIKYNAYTIGDLGGRGGWEREIPVCTNIRRE